MNNQKCILCGTDLEGAGVSEVDTVCAECELSAYEMGFIMTDLIPDYE